MFHNLRHYFENNKSAILRTAIIIAIVLIVIKSVNYAIKTETEENNKKYQSQFSYGNLITFSNSVNTSNIGNSLIGNDVGQAGNNFNNVSSGNTLIPSQQNNISNPDNNKIEGTKTLEKRIQTFLEYCLNGNVSEAYGMISDECKELLFPDKDTFNINYCVNVSGPEKIYTIEKYSGSTYKVRIAENMNNTGSYTALANEDYITVDIKEGEDKLNINRYIGRDSINKTTTKDNITVKVNYKDVFMDYERYNITVTNNNETIIMLDTKNATDTIYLLENRGLKYYAYTNEIIESSLRLRSGSSVNLNIKFKNTYTPSTNTTNYMVFSDVILDFETYRNIENKEDYNNKTFLKVEL